MNSIVAPKLKRYFTDYNSDHRHPKNMLCHWIGIPMITVTTIGLLAQLTFGPEQMLGWDALRMDGGLVLWAAAVLFYLYLDWKIAIPFAVVAFALYFIGRAMPLWALWTIFGLGWVIQFIGHYVYEKRSPAFFKNLEQLLIGPLFFFSKVIGYK